MNGRAKAFRFGNWHKKWRNSQLLRLRLISVAHLLSGNGANAVVMAISTTIAARTLGPAAFGILALVLTVGRVSERILRFESWQPLIRFAAQPDVERDPVRMSELMLYGLMLDVGSALLAALLTVAVGYAIGPLIHLAPQDMRLVAIYAVAIAVNVRGMPTAALRINGQFRTLAYVQLFASSLQAGLALLAMFTGVGLLGFVLIWTAVDIIDAALFVYMGFRTLRILDIPNPIFAARHGLAAKFPGFMSFAWSTNISSTLRTFTQEADTLLVSIFAGTNAAGFYHIAKRFAKVGQQVGAMIQMVVYPDMAKLWASAQHAAFRRITARVQMVLAGAGLGILGVTWLGGQLLIRVAFGEEFAAAYPLLLTQLVAVVLIMHAAPSRSALLAMNQPRLVLVTAVIATALFFAVAFYALPRYGAIGANFAHIAFAAFSAIALDLGWWRGSSQGTGRNRPAPAPQ
jgi:O-antigen/teichoic acid export membrane protein